MKVNSISKFNIDLMNIYLFVLLLKVKKFLISTKLHCYNYLPIQQDMFFTTKSNAYLYLILYITIYIFMNNINFASIKSTRDVHV